MSRSQYALLLGALILSAASHLNAGIVPLSRSSLVQTEGQAKSDNLDQSKLFTTFGFFNDSLLATGGDPNGTNAIGSAEQDFNVDLTRPNQIFGDGNLSTDAKAQFAADDTNETLQLRTTSLIKVDFKVTGHAEPFVVHGEFGSAELLGSTSHFMLTETSAPGTPVLLSFGNFDRITFDANPTLQPGTYEVFADAAAGSSGSDASDPLSHYESANLQLHFRAGTAATAVPLPAAVWTGLPALLVVGFVVGRLR